MIWWTTLNIIQAVHCPQNDTVYERYFKETGLSQQVKIMMIDFSLWILSGASSDPPLWFSGVTFCSQADLYMRQWIFCCLLHISPPHKLPVPTRGLSNPCNQDLTLTFSEKMPLTSLSSFSTSGNWYQITFGLHRYLSMVQIDPLYFRSRGANTNTRGSPLKPDGRARTIETAGLSRLLAFVSPVKVPIILTRRKSPVSVCHVQL